METRSKTSATKRIFLVRHGEGTHNATGDGSTIDPLLTARGQAQAAAIRGHLHLGRCTLVVVSPLSRAVQTAAAIFGEKPSARTVLTPLHSERWSAKCDEGRPKTALVAQFGFLAEWQGLDALEEHWTPTRQNDGRWRAERVPAFIEWLQAQPESEIAVVGHGAYFCDKRLAGRHLDNCEVCEIEL